MNTYPKWEHLPDLELYLDQVLLYINQVTGAASFPDDKGLTASMINNYVKHGHLDKPIKKKIQPQAGGSLDCHHCLEKCFFNPGNQSNVRNVNSW